MSERKRKVHIKRQKTHNVNELYVWRSIFLILLLSFFVLAVCVCVCVYFFSCSLLCEYGVALRHGLVAISCTFSMLQQMFSQVLPSHSIAIVVRPSYDAVVIECNKRHISI